MRGLAALIPLALAAFATGCQSAPEPAPTLHRADDTPSPHIDPEDPLRSPAPPAPVDDIPESDRIEFHERQGLAPLQPLIPIAVGARASDPATRGEGEDESARPGWWPPIGSSRAYTSHDAIGPWDTLRRSHEELMGPHWNRFGWYDW